MANADVTLKINVDAGGATKDVQAFADKAQGAVNKVTGAASALQAGFAAVGGAFIASKILDSVSELVNASSGAEDSFTRFTSALKVSGSYSDKAVRQFEQLAAQIQATSIFDDDAVLSQVALAKSFNTTNAEATKLIKAAVELASATGVSLESAVSTLGRTLDGTAGRLVETLPGLRAFSAEQLRAGAAVDYVTQRFHGFADATAGTFSGSVAQARNAVHNLFESLGDLVTKNETIIAGIKQFTTVINTILGNQGLKTLIVAIGGAVLAIGALISGLGLLAGAITVTTLAAGALSIALGPLALIAVGVAAAGAALGTLAVKAATAKDSVQSLTSQADALKERIADLQKKSDAGIRSFIGKGPTQQLAEAKASLAAIEDKIKNIQQLANSPAAERPVIRIDLELQAKLKALKEEGDAIGVTAEETVKKAYGKQIDQIFRGVDQGILKEAEGAKLIAQLKIKYDKDYREAQLKTIEEVNKRAQEAINAPINTILNRAAPGTVPLGGFSSQLSPDTSGSLGAAGGIATNVLNGAQGALKLLSTTLAQAIGGPLGQIAGQIFEQLAQGPEKVKQMVREFLQAIPQILVNVAKAIPAAIKEFIKDLPAFVDALIKAIPEIINAFIDGIPDIIEAQIEAAPKIIEAIADGMPIVAERLADHAPEIIQRLIQDSPRIIGALIAGIPRVIGAMISGVPNFIAHLLGGGDEFVQKIVDGAGEFVQKLLDSISGGAVSGIFGGDGQGGLLTDIFGGGAGGGGPLGLWKGGSDSSALFSSKSSSDISNETTGAASPSHTVVLQIGEAQLAKVFLNMNRRGFRVS